MKAGISSFPTAAIAGLVAIATADNARAQAMFSGLGDLPGGPFSSQARGVSSEGGVIAGFGNSGDLEAFLWEDETMVGLGFLAIPGQPGDLQSLSYAVSFNGSVVVGQSDNLRLVFDS